MYEVFEQLLHSYGINAYRFCKDTGISQSTISTWKKKGNLISPDIAKVISAYFNVTIGYLMTGENKEDEGYYLNEETRKIAQEVFENKGLRMLLDAGRGLSDDRLRAYAEHIRRMENLENGD